MIYFSILEMNDEEGEAVINVEGGLVHPDSVIQEFTKIGEAIPVFSSLDGKMSVWATSWENLFLPYANNKGADQPAHPRSLISAFVVRYLRYL